MSTPSHNIAAADDSNVGIVGALISYLVDCGFNESHPKAGNLVLALEYVYQPRARFWRDISITHVIEAAAHCFPTLPECLSDMNGGSKSFFQDVQDFLRINAFDEVNAERLLTLPRHTRPSDAASATSWLRQHFAERSLKADLELLERDGNHCGQNALEVTYRFEEGGRGVVVERVGTLVARAYRDSVITHLQNSLRP